MIPSIILIVSLVGFFILFYIKRWELKSGRVFIQRLHLKTDELVEQVSTDIRLIGRSIPGLGFHVSRHVTHHTAYHVSTIALKVLKIVENKLLLFVNMIKGKGVVKKDREASKYLKRVIEHKNNINNNNIV